MDLFQKTLEQLSKKIQGASVYKKDVSGALSTLLGVSITEDQVVIKDKTIYIKVSPTVKTALFLKKSAVLDVLKKYNITFMG